MDRAGPVPVSRSVLCKAHRGARSDRLDVMTDGPAPKVRPMGTNQRIALSMLPNAFMPLVRVTLTPGSNCCRKLHSAR